MKESHYILFQNRKTESKSHVTYERVITLLIEREKLKSKEKLQISADAKRRLVCCCPRNLQQCTEAGLQFWVQMPSEIPSSLGDWLYVNSHDTLAFCNVWTSDLPGHSGCRRLSKPFELGTGLCVSPAFSKCTAVELALFPSYVY